MTDTANDGRPDDGGLAPLNGETDAEAAKDAAILRDERQTERQAPDTANPGEGAGD
jgi:hypothetical protein